MSAKIPKPRQALGRGLSALIPDEPPVQAKLSERDPAFVQLPIDQILPNPFQPREVFDPEAISELADSIREKGIIQPVLVRQKGDRFELVAGERRLRAAREAGIERVPAVVREISDIESLELALIENIQRRDLTPIERARAYRQLLERFDYTQVDLARHLSVNRVSIANTLRLLSLPDPIQKMVHEGKLSAGHAKALLSFSPGADLPDLARRAVEEGWSVRELERLGKRPRSKPRPPTLPDPNIQSLEEHLQRCLGTRVRLRYRKGKGKIEIEYFSDDDLQRLLTTLGIRS